MTLKIMTYDDSTGDFGYHGPAEAPEGDIAFDNSGGHGHSGAIGDGKQVSFNDLLDIPFLWTAEKTPPGPYTASADEFVLCNPTGGGFTVNLPAAPANNDLIGVKNDSSSTNTINISGNGKNIDGAASQSISQAYGWYIFQYSSAANQWMIKGTSAGGSGGAQLNVANTWTKKQTFTPDDANIAVEATGGSGQTGVKGTGGTPNGYGIEGWAGAGSTGKGVIGWGAIGVDGRGINGIGVQGIGANGAYVGVHGIGGNSGGTPGSEGIGVLGCGGGAVGPFTGNGQGVYGIGRSVVSGTGVEGEGGFNNGIGVKGLGKGTGVGVYGEGGVNNGIGVKGTGSGTTGSNGQGAGIYGIGQGLGTYGGGSGVFGCVTGNDGYGVFGFGGKAGVKGIGTTSTSTRAGVVGMGSPFAAEIFSYLQQGVIGQGFDAGCGVQGIGGTGNGVGGVFSGDAVVPTMPTAGQGVYGQGGNNGAGVHGKGHGTGRGVYGEGGGNGGTGVYGSVEWHGGGYGVEAHGDVGDPSPVRSSLRVGPQDNDPSIALNGDIMTTSASHPRGAGRIRLHNGTAWLDVGNALKLVTKKSANYTAGYNERVPYDPTVGITLKPPASPTLGDRWAIKNVATNTTAVTVDGNGQNIEDPIAGGSPVASFTIGVANISIEWQFMNSASGNAWHVVC